VALTNSIVGGRGERVRNVSRMEVVIVGTRTLGKNKRGMAEGQRATLWDTGEPREKGRA